MKGNYLGRLLGEILGRLLLFLVGHVLHVDGLLFLGGLFLLLFLLNLLILLLGGRWGLLHGTIKPKSEAFEKKGYYLSVGNAGAAHHVALKAERMALAHAKTARRLKKKKETVKKIGLVIKGRLNEERPSFRRFGGRS